MDQYVVVQTESEEGMQMEEVVGIYDRVEMAIDCRDGIIDTGGDARIEGD